VAPVLINACTVCGATGALPMPLPPPVTGILLCAAHASQLAAVAGAAIAEMAR